MISSYHIGHPAYRGVNTPRTHTNRASALTDLISRGILPCVAEKALATAEQGVHATCTVVSANRTYMGTVEVTARFPQP